MLDPKKYLLTWWDKVKMGIALVCLILVIVQFYAAGKAATENDTKVSFIQPEHYASLSYGEEIAAEITKEDMITKIAGSGANLSYYVVRVNENNVVVMKTLSNSECNSAMNEMLSGTRDSITYKGRVNILPETDHASLNVDVLLNDTLHSHGLDRHLNDILIPWEIDITLYDMFSDTRYILACVTGALLMMIPVVWCCWKPFKKIGLQYAARMGKIDLELLTKDDLPVEQDWFTEEDSKKAESEELPPMQWKPRDTQPIDFYESGTNEEGNFYVQKREEPELPPDEDGFIHEHKNY